MTRLEGLAPHIAALLRAADPDQLRAVTRAVTQLAVNRSGLVDPAVDQAMAALVRAGSATLPERAAISALVDSLDEVYFDLQQAAESDPSLRDRFLAQFARARAASAIACAFDADPLRAAEESVYEAQAAVEDLDAIRAIVEAEIRS